MLRFLKFFFVFSVQAVICQSASIQWEPQIAVLCQYNPQYLSTDGKWVLDTTQELCTKDKMELLKYCKKVYPDNDINNIVESSHYQKLGGWGNPKWVKTFRCLEGQFQSDALLVPEGCLFDHIHNATSCLPFYKWNRTGAAACNDRKMLIRSFAMLLPCGISLFSGVEFVCCPKEEKWSPSTEKSLESTEKKQDDSLEDYDDYYFKTGSPLLSQKTDQSNASAPVTIQNISSNKNLDPYFNAFNPKLEHRNYKIAQQRLEENHREKVTQVMKNWSDLEEKYQDMRQSDKKNAQLFKEEMTQKFQMSVQTLEEEETAAKHQLSAIHQQRVLERINQKKRDAIKCYTHSLTQQVPDIDVVEKCLRKLLRALHKDRTHALAHYKHALLTQKYNMDSVMPEKTLTLSRLSDIDRAMNQSLLMLRRFPDLSQKLSQSMIDYVQALRLKDEIPGLGLNMSTENEEIILESYKNAMQLNIKHKEKQREEDKQKIQARNKERQELEKNVNAHTVHNVTNTTVHQDIKIPVSEIKSTPTIIAGETSAKAQHNMKSEFSQVDAHFIVKEEKHQYNKFFLPSVFIICTSIIVLIVKFKRNSKRSDVPIVNQENCASVPPPEDKHLYSMQINGYENPTYKYFEVQTD